MNELLEKAERLKTASQTLAMLSTEEKNAALEQIAKAIDRKRAVILAENEKDMAAGRSQGLSPALLDRLQLTNERIDQIISGVRQVASLPDPVGDIIEEWTRPNGLRIQTVRVPLGVIGMVYEARPNVTVDAVSLCLKTGNAVLLRGSSSALHSNKALVSVMKEALRTTAIPETAIELLEDTSRETAQRMFRLNDYLDVLIPRGGAGLIRSVVENATVPVLETGVGNCHIFVDESAERSMAIDIVLNAKLQRPSVCNAIETVLIHERWPYVGELLEALHARGVELRGDRRLAAAYPFVSEAAEEDWHTEYLAPILAIKLVTDVDEAIQHIHRYGTKHSEAIITENEAHVRRFFQAVDAAVLYHNASTRFTDGEQFGYGAEIGISTQKLHARGPMGLVAITTTKSLVYGTGQIRTV
ncbi:MULTISPECIES: glutamate-5-semialdehyde dehydrogenase [Geobacillus]|jgi:glutamate-5-semialdehyde dehydrogenase|uniref:glutamate-5-semialdehyde dehydrogenase n=1 Tax=Geobacillus TaxID=129337 RepID=UPI0009BD777C|nr:MULTISPECIES: glutamate-5-semialdehyde dehydrogenase [Geobacillus]ARP43084.1 Gamma-glutamyl phosphate reductase [Geobacillus thermodenitrificans]MEC5189263.1 glutamate-5-semialdehyde dehydrogenase [Geobacillus thermodenitrificans]MED0662064.1 glutamate-5-semialdehyde dehydrogenase [Geobacillus thermodenitrificans]MED3718938.1 glutamate-5-semialdehyde dehydrogenase [Geobacillus thermodenitrificans]NNU88226.1 glutamate-5-semialdehyde dehydrogenase [Geobacillus sp. MR]